MDEVDKSVNNVNGHDVCNDLNGDMNKMNGQSVCPFTRKGSSNSGDEQKTGKPNLRIKVPQAKRLKNHSNQHEIYDSLHFQDIASNVSFYL